MQQIPDAPWIRDAEMNGLPADDPVECPVCGRECEEFFLDEGDDIIGCDKCIRSVDAFDWWVQWHDDGGDEE